jgi:hypothetical protein
VTGASVVGKTVKIFESNRDDRSGELALASTAILRSGFNGLTTLFPHTDSDSRRNAFVHTSVYIYSSEEEVCMRLKVKLYL